MEPYLRILSNIVVYFSMFLPFLYLKGFTINGRAYRLFTFYLMFIGLLQYAQIHVTTVWGMENIFLSHFYFIGQFILLTLFFYELLQKKWIYFLMGVSLVVIAIQYVLHPDLFPVYNKFGIFFTHIILVALALLYLYKSMGERSIFQLISVGIVLYFTSTSIIFYSGNMVFNPEISQEVMELIMNINSVLYFAFQILIFVEWWKIHSIQVRNS